jgi:flagellar basal-body rod modification protein FlgD
MIETITNLPQVEEPSLYADKANGSMGQEQFLTLLLAQLKNQDPLNPMEGTEFSAQLAQFSSLEQLVNMNDKLESLASVQEGSNQLQALNLIGKEVEADGNVLSLKAGESAKGGFSIEEQADCTVNIFGQSGNLIRKLELGELSAGSHEFEWDGKDLEMEQAAAGAYSFQIEAVNVRGESLSVETRVQGRVDSINLEQADPLLYIGEMALTLDQVKNIKQAVYTPAEEEQG